MSCTTSGLRVRSCGEGWVRVIVERVGPVGPVATNESHWCGISNGPHPIDHSSSTD